MKVIEVKNLKKNYGNVEALKGVSFDVNKGEIFGLLGPNGAGKTTITNILSGVLTKDSGTIRMLRKDPAKHREETNNRINLVSSYSWLSGILSVYENLRVYGKLYGVKNLNEKIDSLLDLFEISQLRDKRVYSLSGGETTRVNLCKGLLNDPEILLLDEPTVGLDPDIAEKTRKIIKGLQREQNMSMLFTSHNMYDVEELCNRVAFLHKGRLLKIGTVAGLKRLIKADTVELEVFPSKTSFRQFLKRNGFEIFSIKKNKAVIRLSNADISLYKIIQPLTRAGFSIKDISIKKPHLEDVFIKIAREEL